ncbi:hypothetical protein [Sporomusa sphaeroides]|uniref:hypothetical protein n=1 Tax=Sporomusa sphaeroides TaxID=47679 RepID=UPI002C93AAC3|nr:hypothetical protein [Sporomusa sphaeroides]HML31975.1 hypothetical protein [Sporomusa sphaeroides]
MKKSVVTFLLMAMVVSASTGIGLANPSSDVPQVYPEDQALIAEVLKPVILDKEYPDWGFRSHSWITGTGSDTVAHTQLIDMATGTVIKQLDQNCSYTETEFEYSSN